MGQNGVVESDFIGDLLSAFAKTTGRDRLALLIVFALPVALIGLLFAFPPSSRFLVSAQTDVVTFALASSAEGAKGRKGLAWQIPNPQISNLEGLVQPAPALVNDLVTVEFSDGQIVEVTRRGTRFRIEIVGGTQPDTPAFFVLDGSQKQPYQRDNFIEFSGRDEGILLPFRAQVTVGKELQPGVSATPILRSGSLYIETYENWPSASGLKAEMRRELFAGERISAPDAEAVGFLEITKSEPIFASFSLFGSSVTVSRFGITPYQITQTLYSKFMTSPMIGVFLGIYAALPTFLLSILIFLVRRRTANTLGS